MNICYTILHKYAYFYIFQPSLSTEELHAEMKNLEGLMKDLNSISNPSALHHHHHHHKWDWRHYQIKRRNWSELFNNNVKGNTSVWMTTRNDIFFCFIILNCSCCFVPKDLDNNDQISCLWVSHHFLKNIVVSTFMCLSMYIKCNGLVINIFI